MKSIDLLAETKKKRSARVNAREERDEEKACEMLDKVRRILDDPLRSFDAIREVLS